MNKLLFLESVCSDRGFVAGELRLLDIASGKTLVANTCDVDISHVEWRSDRLLLLAGHRGFETVVGVYDVSSNDFRETWSSSEISTPGRFASVTGLGETAIALSSARVSGGPRRSRSSIPGSTVASDPLTWAIAPESVSWTLSRHSRGMLQTDWRFRAGCYDRGVMARRR